MQQFYKDVPQVKYEGKNSDNPFAFKYYNPGEVVGGKTMKEQLKFALSYWHTLAADGLDMFGVGTRDNTFGQKMGTIDQAKAKADAGFEFMQKLGIEYFCFHDADIAPRAETLAESNKNLEIMAEYIAGKMKETGIKCLWGTANCFGHPRYMHGAATSPNADVFAYAAGQIKSALEVTKLFGGSGYVFWGGREGYETLLNTNMALELDNLGKMLNMSVDYARKIGFTGDFYIEPKPKEPTKHQYDFDASTAILFLNKYGLAKDFKMNIEANHATLAGHTFQHELRTAAVNGMFGSIDANQGDMLLGWDTDQFPTNVYDTALCMYEVLKVGGFTNGGLNFDAKQRRGSFELKDTALAYIAGMDAFALGLKVAYKMIQDGRIDKFVADRYRSYESGIGAQIKSGKATLESLSDYALKMGDVKEMESGRQELLENIMNNIMFNL